MMDSLFEEMIQLLIQLIYITMENYFLDGTEIKVFLPRLDKYRQQHEIYGDRNSFFKTGHDATFMRMKDDHMKNGQ
jgi:hypothetical protein